MVPLCTTAASNNFDGWRRGKGWLGLENGIYIHTQASHKPSNSWSVLAEIVVPSYQYILHDNSIARTLKYCFPSCIWKFLITWTKKSRERFNLFTTTSHDGRTPDKKTLCVLVKNAERCWLAQPQTPSAEVHPPVRHLPTLPPVACSMQANPHGHL